MSRTEEMGRRQAVSHQTLDLASEVRILPPQQRRAYDGAQRAEEVSAKLSANALVVDKN